jgi:hypothetical protein
VCSRRGCAGRHTTGSALYGSFVTRGISQSKNFAIVSIRVSTAIAGTCGTTHRAHPLLIRGGAVKRARGAPASGRL